MQNKYLIKYKGVFMRNKNDVVKEYGSFFYNDHFSGMFGNEKKFNNKVNRCEYIFNKLNCYNKTILDLGCGWGFHAILMKILGAKYVTGVDFDSKKINIIKKMLKKELDNLKNINFLTGDITNLNIKDNSYDTIFIFNVISHVKNENSFIKEIKRILKPNGAVFIVDNNNGINPLIRINNFLKWRNSEVKSVRVGVPPYLILRKKLILEFFPKLNKKLNKKLVKKTKGMDSKQIKDYINFYLKNGKFSKRFKFIASRNPITGEFHEVVYSPYKLAKKFESHGFETFEIRSKYLFDYNKRPLISQIFKVFPRMSLLLATAFELTLTKK